MRILRWLMRLLAPKERPSGGASYLSTHERLDRMPAYEREMRTRTHHPDGVGGA